jgi:hypothetical protein
LTSIAQPANPFIGSWKVTFTSHTKKGLPEQREALLVVGAAGGSWRVYKESRNDPCGRSEVPIEISSVDEKRLIGKVERSPLPTSAKTISWSSCATNRGVSRIAKATPN